MRIPRLFYAFFSLFANFSLDRKTSRAIGRHHIPPERPDEGESSKFSDPDHRQFQLKRIKSSKLAERLHWEWLYIEHQWFQIE